MKKFLIFAYTSSISLTLIGIFYTLNGGITMPVKRHGLVHFIGWPAWILCLAPIFLAFAMWSKFDKSHSLNEKQRNILYSLSQFSFLLCCAVAGFNSTEL